MKYLGEVYFPVKIACHIYTTLVLFEIDHPIFAILLGLIAGTISGLFIMGAIEQKK